MTNKLKFVSALAVLPVLLFAGNVYAAVQSTIEGGDIYRVKNVTQNSAYADSTSANACDVLQYQVRLHNPGPDQVLTNVRVSVAFGTAPTTQDVSIITARTDNGSPASTSDTATANISSAQTESYVTGSTQLLDPNGNVMQTLPDTITTSGVSIGNLGISLNEKRFVRFQMRVSCPSKPTPTPTPITPVTTPKALPNTGAGDVLGIFAGATAAGSAAHMAITARRNRR
jgi:hypothetical protein